MVDISRFLRLKDAGFAWVKDNHLYFKRFDPETGAELSPEEQQISREELETRRTNLQTELEAINAILAEL
jgi:hypothetical protein